MTAREDDHKLVLRWAQAINERDTDTLVKLAHPEIACFPLRVGVGGHYEGRAGVTHWMDDLTANDIGHHVHVESVRTLRDGRVALFGTMCLDGEPLSPYALVALIRDGKVALMRSYLSDEATLERLGLLG